MISRQCRIQAQDGIKWSFSSTCLRSRNSRYFLLFLLRPGLIGGLSPQEDPAAILDIKEDIRGECAKLGEVTNVVLFDKEPEGVASIRYSNVEAASACVRLMDGRFFGGEKVEAYIANGSEKFKKSKEGKVLDTGEEDEDEGHRLDKFGSWLEEDVGKT
jgi:HIV Tat-specific factor 1